MQREVNTSMPERIWITGESCLWPTFRQFHASDLDHSNDDGTCDYPEYVRADLFTALLDRAEKAEAELAKLRADGGDAAGLRAAAQLGLDMARANDLYHTAEKIQEALARPSAPETLGWAVVGRDGKIHPQSINNQYYGVKDHKGERVVRVAIRVVEDRPT